MPPAWRTYRRAHTRGRKKAATRAVRLDRYKKRREPQTHSSCRGSLRPEMHQIVHADVGAQAGGARDGVIAETGHIGKLELGAACPASELRRSNEAFVAVRAARNQLEDVFGGHDAEQKGFQASIQGGNDDV